MGRGGAGRRDLRVSGADVVQWYLLAAAAAARCAPRGGARRPLLLSPGGREGRQSLSRLSHLRGSRVGVLPGSHARRSPDRLVCAPDVASRSPLALRTAPPASCAVRGRRRGACCSVVLGFRAGAAEA